MSVSPETRRILRIIVLAQCVGLTGPLLFGNGFMLAYFTRLGLSDYLTLFLLSLIPLINMLLTVPMARLADGIGKKRVGGLGIAAALFGFAILPLAAFARDGTAGWIAAGVLIFATGSTASGASWFALLSPIVPEQIRGRWFGQMRSAWQTVSIVLTLGIMALLHRHDSIPVYQGVLALCGALMAGRLFLYLKIPELEPAQPPDRPFPAELAELLRTSGFLRFTLYLSLLSFLTGAVPGLLGLLEKHLLGFSDSRLVLMGNLMAAGTVSGFLAGGKLTDHLGPRPVFQCGHLLFILSLTGVLFREFIPLPPVIVLGAASFLFGSMQGATGIAGTSELLALIPPKNKSLSTGLNMTMTSAGTALAGFLCSALLKTGNVLDGWHFLSAYDVLLAALTLIALPLAGTTVLVPALRHIRIQWIPQNR